MTRKEIQEKYYPVPEGLTKRQREYHERMSVNRACAFQRGYDVAMEEVARDISDLERKVSEYSIKNAAYEAQLETMEKENVAMTEKAIACLDSVKAMMENTDGSMTHRQRDFYSRAIVKYIEKIRWDLKASLEPTPF